MMLPLIGPAAAETADPYLWLEDIAGDRALAWVRERNAAAEQEFAASPRFEPMREQILKVLDSREKIPFVSRVGAYYYNLWQDEKNPRGLWRRIPASPDRRPSCWLRRAKSHESPCPAARHIHSNCHWLWPAPSLHRRRAVQRQHFLPRPSHVAADTQPVLVVPGTAVAERNGRSVVFVVQGGRAVEVPVVVGRQLGSSLAIREGLHPGVQVVDSVGARLRSGAKVTVQ